MGRQWDLESGCIGCLLGEVVEGRYDLRGMMLCTVSSMGYVPLIREGVSVKEEPNVGGVRSHFGAAALLNYRTITLPVAPLRKVVGSFDLIAVQKYLRTMIVHRYHGLLQEAADSSSRPSYFHRQQCNNLSSHCVEMHDSLISKLVENL